MGHRTSLFLILLSTAFLLLATSCQTQPTQLRLMPVDSNYAGMETVDAIDAFIDTQNIDKGDPDWRLKLIRPPRVAFDPEKKYYWILKTSLGGIKIELLPQSAPMHVSSTIYLSRIEFYDGLTFHRIIPKFMAQGGDPLGTGAGGPGYRIPGEFYGEEKHKDAGVVSMANSGPRTDGSQFYITFATQDALDGKHTIFGQVVEGMGTVKSIEMRGSESGEPRQEVLLLRTLIRVE